MEKERKIFKLFYVAELLTLIATLGTAIATSFLTTESTASVLTGAGLAVVCAVLAIIGGIILLVAMIKGRNISRYIAIALFFTVVVFVLNLFTAGNSTGFWASKAALCSDLLDLVVSCAVIYAVLDVAGRAGNAGLADAARSTATPFLIIAIVAAFSDIVTSFLAKGGAAAMVLAIAYMVLILIGYVMYLRLLRKASKEL